MHAARIDDRLTVSAQPDLAAFGGFAGQGFTAVINIRPDGEEPGQPGNAAEAAAARAAGLDYAFVPVTGATITEADVRAFQKSLWSAKGPVLAHCKSGMRALTLHVLGEVLDGRMRREDVEAFGARHGFALSGAVSWLDRHAAKVPRVTGFLGEDRHTAKPMHITDKEAERILHQVQEGVERPKPSVTFEIGEQVRVSDGPFASFNGFVQEVDEERARLKVEVSIFGRAVPVDLEFGQVEKG